MKFLALHTVAETIGPLKCFQLAIVLAAEVLYKFIAGGGGRERLEDVPALVLLRLSVGLVHVRRDWGDPANPGHQVSDESADLLVAR